MPSGNDPTQSSDTESEPVKEVEDAKDAAAAHAAIPAETHPAGSAHTEADPQVAGYKSSVDEKPEDQAPADAAAGAAAGAAAAVPAGAAPGAAAAAAADDPPPKPPRRLLSTPFFDDKCVLHAGDLCLFMPSEGGDDGCVQVAWVWVRAIYADGTVRETLEDLYKVLE